jgi:hypothetical protein
MSPLQGPSAWASSSCGGDVCFAKYLEDPHEELVAIVSGVGSKQHGVTNILV